MNSRFSLGIRSNVYLIAAVTALMPIAAKAQVAGSDMVRIEGSVKSEQERKNLKGTQADKVTQDKTITITITGAPKSPETRTGTWVAYGRDMKTHSVQMLESGDFKVDLSSGPQKVETKQVSANYTPEHSTSTGRIATNGRMPAAKKVAAEGKKYVGYIVTVKDGDKIVGKFADPMGLDSQVK